MAADVNIAASNLLAEASECSPRAIKDVILASNKRSLNALLLAHLAWRRDEARAMLASTFHVAVKDSETLLMFVSIMRSSLNGSSSSLGSFPKRLVARWLIRRDPAELLHDAGRLPGLGYTIAMSHPHPVNEEMSESFKQLLAKYRNSRWEKLD